MISIVYREMSKHGLWYLSYSGLCPLSRLISNIATQSPGAISSSSSSLATLCLFMPLLKLCPLIRMHMPHKFQLVFHISTLLGSFPCPGPYTPAFPPSYSQVPSPFWLPVHLKHSSVSARIAILWFAALPLPLGQGPCLICLGNSEGWHCRPWGNVCWADGHTDRWLNGWMNSS